MLLSKRPEMFLPEQSFIYSDTPKLKFTKDENADRILQRLLSYRIYDDSNEKLNLEISKSIFLANMTTLNCPEEVELTKKLLSLHPWAEMVRFTRSGGEANAIAIRIARAASRKDGVAICGYHGWHDWYLSVNLRGKNKLSKHLLKGLEPAGVPKSLKNTVYPFKYGDYAEIEKIVKNKILA